MTRIPSAILLFALSAAAVGQTPPAVSEDEKKAREAFLAGKADEALKHLQAAAKSGPVVNPPKVVLAQWFWDAKKGQEARRLLEQAAIEEPRHPAVFLVNALFAFNEGRITDTILSGEMALAATNDTPPRWEAETRKRFQRDARRWLVDGYNVRGDHDKVRTHLLALLEGDPKNSRLRVQLAHANFRLARHDDAFAELQTAFRDDMSLNPPELEMALLWAQKADFPKVEEWYAKAAKAHPDAPAVHRGCAEYWLGRGNAGAAKPHLDAAVRLDPKSRETKGLVGLAARYAGNLPAAAAAFEELVRDHPNYPFAVANLAQVLADSADPAQRRRAVGLGEVLVGQLKSAEAHAVYGYALLKDDRVADAEKELLRAAQAGSSMPDLGYFAGRLLEKQGKFADAARVLKDALASPAPFVYRTDAQALLAEVEKKVPKK